MANKNKVIMTNETILNRIQKLRNLMTLRWNDENKPPTEVVYIYVDFLDYIINDMANNLLTIKLQENEKTKTNICKN